MEVAKRKTDIADDHCTGCGAHCEEVPPPGLYLCDHVGGCTVAHCFSCTGWRRAQLSAGKYFCEDHS